MLYPVELMGKLHQAGQQQVNDFSFIDQDGEHVEVHVKQIDPERTNHDWDLL